MNPKTARMRRRGRELAVQMLVSWDANPTDPKLTVIRIGELTRASARHLEAAERLARTVWDRLPRIDACLDRTIHTPWRGKLGRVERSVLRVAVGELLTKTAPPAVVLSEALEVARLYAGEAAVPFVHGVLDSVVRNGASPADGGEGDAAPPADPETPGGAGRPE